MRRAVGIVRVSQVKGREGESFASPAEQRERIEGACERDGLALVNVLDELDVSGATPLERRTGLRSAVEAVEAGRIEVIVAAYFDRLVRSLKVQDELVSRVERAGGQVLAVDIGRVTNGSAGQWLSGTIIGAVSEYQRRTSAERSADAQRRAVARGVIPFPNVPPGYRKRPDGTLERHPDEAPIIATAFRMRADGASIKDLRAYLAANGIRRSYHGVCALLTSRVVLGEIRFGELVNEDAHEPIVEDEVWRAVQRARIPRGRKPVSDRLLARLGVLRCGSCGARMTVGTQTQNGRRYPDYRCPPTGDCTRRVCIKAELVESIAVSAVQKALSDVEGRASASDHFRDAERALQETQDALDGFIRLLSGLEDEPSVRHRLAELREARDEAQAKLDQLGSGAPSTITINAADDWDRLTHEERRALIRATVQSLTVSSGRGAERVAVKLFSE